MQNSCAISLSFIILFLFCRYTAANCQSDVAGDQWSIGLLFGGSALGAFSPCLHLNNSHCIRNPVLTCSDVTDVNASFVADPFLHIEGWSKPWHLFFEVYNFDLRRGEIGCAVSHDNVSR